MRKRILKKLTDLHVERYYLMIRQGMGGMGGCKPLNPREQLRCDKLEHYLYRHPLKAEYDRIIERQLLQLLI